MPPTTAPSPNARADRPPTPAAETAAPTGSLLRWGGIGLTAAAAVFFCIHAAENASELAALKWNASGIAVVGAALGLYCVMLLAAPLAWLALLRGVGETPRYIQLLSISLVSQFAKYIPGNVAHHIGRVALARASGFDTTRVIVSMTVEAGWVVFTGATIGILAVLMGASSVLDGMPALPAFWRIACAGVAGALAPIAGAWLLSRWRPGPLRQLLGTASIDPPPIRALLGCFGVHAILFLLMGGILYLLAERLFGLANADYWLSTGIFAVAWVAGFIVPGAPGGLGVREAILVAALGPLHGEAVAVAIAVLLRAVTTAGDGLGFILGLAVRRASRSTWRSRRPAEN